jgi:hypothetical protein
MKCETQNRECAAADMSRASSSPRFIGHKVNHDDAGHQFHAGPSTTVGIQRDFVRSKKKHSARSDPRNHRRRPRDSRTSGSVHLAYALVASKFPAAGCSLLTLRLQRAGTGHDIAVGFRHPTRPSRELAILVVFASAFQPSSVGLGCRVIPALGGFAQQFQPWRVSVSLSDCRLPLLQKRKQSVPDPPKNCLRLPGERPPSLRVAPTEQGTKG